MKTKLTLTISEELIPYIKKVARIKGSSVSRLVENSLRKIVEENDLTFSEKWRGKFTTTVARNTRHEYLSKRHS